MTEKELLVKFIGKTLNKPADEVSSLLFKKEADGSEVLKDDSFDSLIELDKARASVLDKQAKDSFDKGYKKAQAETLSKFEKDVKEKYGFTEDKQGTELIDAIIAAKNTGTELEEDKVKRSKTYLDTVDGLKKEKDKVVKEWQDKFEGREKQLQKEATFKSISEKAITFIKSLNPILPTDETRAKNQLTILTNLLSEFEYEIKDDGKIVVLKKDGDEFKVLVDDHKHPVSFEDMVKERAGALWDFKQGGGGGGTGNRNDAPGKDAPKGYKGPIPKSEDEYSKLIADNAGNEEVQIGITKAWVAEQNSKK